MADLLRTPLTADTLKAVLLLGRLIVANLAAAADPLVDGVMERFQ